MKILELHYSTAAAGAERVVVDLSNELSLHEEVVLCTIEDDSNPASSCYKKELLNSVKYVNLGCQSGLQFKALWRVYNAIKKEKPDIVHAHTDLMCVFLPALLCRKTKYVHTLHSIASKRITKQWLYPLYRYFYKNHIIPITISRICDESYMDFYGMNNSVMIDNGRSALIITSEFKSVKEEIVGLKLHNDDKVFIHVARCSEAKNQGLLIDAFNRFLNEGNHGILLLLGVGYDDVENAHLLERANKGIYWLGVKNNVADYIANSSFFILSSLWEGAPISLLEAISMGVVPICTPAGGIPDIVKNKKIGFVSRDFSLESFYKTLMEAYVEEPNFNKEGLKKYFKENFSMLKCADNYLQIFKKL